MPYMRHLENRLRLSLHHFIYSHQPRVTFFALLLIAVALCAFVTPYAEEELHIGVAYKPKTFDPRFATDAASNRLLNFAIPGLIDVDAAGNVSADFATSWHVDNNQHFAFTLPADATFTDGSPLTSAEVKALHESIIAPDSTSPLKAQYSIIESIETPDARTVIFHLVAPHPYAINVFQLPVVKQHDSMNTTVIGAGDFLWLKHTTQGDVWLHDNAHNRTYVFKVIPDATVRYLKLKKGELDILHNDIVAEFLPLIQKNGFNIISTPSASYTYLGFNHKYGITRHKAIRQAIAHGINIEAIRHTLLYNMAVPASSLLDAQHPFVWNAPPYEYDPAKAKQLVQQFKEPLTLNLHITTSAFMGRVAQVIQQQLAEVGIKVNIKAQEWGAFYAQVQKGTVESYILTWVGPFQPDFYPYVFNSANLPPQGLNRGRYSNPVMDNALEVAAQNPTLESVSAIQKLQYEDVIYLPLWKRKHVLISQPTITGCKLDTGGGYTGLKSCVIQP